MEARSARFHSGLDLRTAGREGVAVRAPVAGHVLRLRSSPTGYGVAVYLRISDGRTLVFAHLSALSDRLRGPMLRAQFSTGRYTQDIRFREPGVAVAAGELLALSGSTGVGAPHLHFELRDAAEEVTNPIGLFELPDGRAPRIDAVRLVPLEALSRVSGRASVSTFADGDAAPVRGLVGVQVRVCDRRPGNEFRLMPRRVELWFDGELAYSIEQKHFRFDQSSQMALEFVPSADGPSWLRLYRRRGNDLAGRDGSGADGLRIEESDGGPHGPAHQLEVRAIDEAGNVASFALSLTSTSVPLPSAVVDRTAMWDLTLHPGERVLGVTALGRPGLAPGPLRVESLNPVAGSMVALDGWTPVLDGSWEAALEWEALPPSPWTVRAPSGHVLLPGQFFLDGARADTLRWSDLELSAVDADRFPGGVLELRLLRAPRVPGPEWALAQSWGWRLGAWGWAHPGGVRLRWRMGEVEASASDKVGLVFVDLDGDTTWVGTATDAAEVTGLSAAPLETGQLLLLKDLRPPRWIDSTPDQRRVLHERSHSEREAVPGLTLARWPSFVLRVEEEGSGLDPDSIQAWLDGQPWPLRYDPDASTVAWDFDRDPGPGAHRLRVELQDRAGHRVEAEWMVDLVP